MIKPLSENEIESLKKFFNNSGWDILGTPETLFRYSTNKLKNIVLTTKFPLETPFKLNIPYEIGDFKLSLTFQFRFLNKTIYAVLSNLSTLLKNLQRKTNLQQNLPFHSEKDQLLKLLNLLFPEPNKNEPESSWINRVRVLLLNKREKSDIKEIRNNYIENKSKKIVANLEKMGLFPTSSLPWELAEGIPKVRHSETLFFSNDEKMDEFFIFEKDFLTYFKDFQYQKCYIRTFFETYNPYILYSLFNGYEDFQIENLVLQWIKSARLLLNDAIEIIDQSGIPKVQPELIDFNHQKVLANGDFVQDRNNFPLSPLYYEAKLTKDFKPINWNLFDTPPNSFELLEIYNQYKMALKLIKQYKFNQAINILNESLKVFNRYRQRVFVVLSLFALAKIAHLSDKKDLEINYYQNALDVTKAGNVPIKYIIEIHYQLGKLLFNTQDLEEALNHFDVIIKFLTNEDIDFTRKTQFLGNAFLYKALVLSEREKRSEAKELFKQAFEIGKNNSKVKFNYNLLRSRFFKKKGYASKAFRTLVTSLKDPDFEKKAYKKIRVKTLLELAELSIHEHENKKRGLRFLKKCQNYLSQKTVSGIQNSIKWNLLMSDYFQFLEHNNKKAQQFLKKSRELKKILLKIQR